MLDAAALEKKGVHTVTIVWDTFEKAAKVAARVQGTPEMDLVIIPHRQGKDTAEDQRAKAAVATVEIAGKLVAG